MAEDDISQPSEDQPDVEALKSETERRQAERLEYFNFLTPPFSDEQKERLQQLDNLALDAMAKYLEARREQG